jgi:hypothetical protein
MTFDVNYPQNPWVAVETKERTPWYVPDLYNVYKRSAIYNRFVSTSFNHNGPRATELVLTSLLMPHGNHDPIGVRTQWLDSSYMDSFARKITFQRYGGKLSMNRYDDLVTYWRHNGVQGLRRIINEGLGFMMTTVMDKLARDAFLSAPFAMYGDGAGTWGGTDFSAIDGTDFVTTDLILQVNLGLKERDTPGMVTGEANLGQEVVCITSPGVLYNLRQEVGSSGNSNAFIDVMKYQAGKQIIRGEVGTYQGVRFVETNNSILYNCGAIGTQVTIDAAVAAGDGAPDPAGAVDNVEFVGQSAATHAITVSTTVGFAVGDYVTIHVDRTNAHGITNGVDFTDGKLINRRIVAITGTTGGTLAFDRPVMEPFSVDLGSGVYGYVTIARNIHTMIFLVGSDGVAMGVARPPAIHTPGPVDDLEMIHRFSWDAYMGWQAFNKNAFEVVFLAANNRIVGAKI